LLINKRDHSKKKSNKFNNPKIANPIVPSQLKNTPIFPTTEKKKAVINKNPEKASCLQFTGLITTLILPPIPDFNKIKEEIH
jgi:hypothetical protein